MASFLNKQKRESLDALACAAEAESRLNNASTQWVVLSFLIDASSSVLKLILFILITRVLELSQQLTEKVAQLTAVRGVQQECARFPTLFMGNKPFILVVVYQEFGPQIRDRGEKYGARLARIYRLHDSTNASLISWLSSVFLAIFSFRIKIASPYFRLSEIRDVVQEQKLKLQVLETTITFQEQKLKDSEDR